MRFGKVFEQSYIRFNDLKQAESQALEAIKRASVDRVRAEIASMRTTSDLERIQPLIWNELITLGVPFIRCGVLIMDEEQEQVQSFLSTPDGKAIAVFRQPYNTPGEISRIVEHWHQKKCINNIGMRPSLLILQITWCNKALSQVAKNILPKIALLIFIYISFPSCKACCMQAIPQR